MKISLRIGLTALSLGIVASSNAWVNTGHMIVNAIAYSQLTPNARQAVGDILKAETEPQFANFLSLATWADAHKTKRNGPWHYKDIFFRADGGHTDLHADDENAIWAIQTFVPLLSEVGATRSEKLTALRFITHIVGDIHQPLHATARVTSAHPNGDRGGNDFAIKPISGMSTRGDVKNLHLYWDFACGDYSDCSPDLSSADRAYIEGKAKAYMKEFPRAAFTLVMKPKLYESWLQESFFLAKTQVYKLTENASIPQEYEKSGRRLCRQRIALAGYRLADILNRAFK